MDKKLLSAAIAFILSLISAGSVLGQSLVDVSASLEVSNESEIFVGDPIDMTLTIRHPADHHVIFPELDSEWGDFTIQSQSAPTTVVNDDGTITSTQNIDVRLFKPGTFNTPPLSLTVADGTGQLLEVPVPPAPVTVSSVLVEGDTELRDIKPQVDLPYINLIPWGVAGVVAAGLVVVFVVLKRRRKQQLALGAIDNRLPHEIAVDELREIKNMGLPEQGLFKKHYTLVSETMRTYIERSYRFPVLERTTAEIQAGLKLTAIPPSVAREFLSLLEDSDLVKFSKFKPSESDAYSLLAQAFTIVEETKPDPLMSEPPSKNGSRELERTLAIPNTNADHEISRNGKVPQAEVRR